MKQGNQLISPENCKALESSNVRYKNDNLHAAANERIKKRKRERDREGTIVAATLMKGKTTNELPVRKRKKKRRQGGRSVRSTDRGINHEFSAQGSDETSCKVHLESGIQ